MIKSSTNFLIIFFIFQLLKSLISQIDQNGYNPFCDETLHMYSYNCWPFHTCFAVCSGISIHALTVVAIYSIDTCASVLTGVAVTFVDICMQQRETCNVQIK